MKARQNWIQSLRYYSSATVINLLALLFLGYCLSPIFIRQVVAQTPAAPVPAIHKQSSGLSAPLISGMPNRLTIPSLNIDLPIDPGTYDLNSQSWTLHDLRASYAVVTPEPNNLSGGTFLYGHNNYQTLGAIKSITPGQLAYIYTTNNHIFTYSFRDYSFVEPNDTSVLTYQGSPMLTIQTCTGVWNETRGMFHFDFVKAQ